MQRKYPFKRRFHLAFIAVLLVFTAVAGVVYAKYIKSVPFGGNVTISADLAGGFSLYEHNAVPQPDGSYRLDPNAEVIQNSYSILPGLDIPKDPAIKIEDKTTIPAYLYLEAVDNFTGTNITYSLDPVWYDIGINGPHGGRVYVYTANGTTPYILDGSVKEFNINILKDEKITVSQDLDRGFTDNVSIQFYAYMAQKISDDAKSDFTAAGFTAS